MKLLILNVEGVVLSVNVGCRLDQDQAERLIRIGNHKVLVVADEDAHVAGDVYVPSKEVKSLFERVMGIFK